MRMLLVQNDAKGARSLGELISGTGIATVEYAETEIEALELVKRHEYDIVLLELVPPNLEGYEVLRRMRSAQLETPVIVLSALCRAEAKVKALGLGADDVLSMPFDTAELLARVQAVVRRSKGFSQPELRVGPLSVNVGSRGVAVNGSPVRLTVTEYTILELLVLRKGAVLTKEALLSHLYGGLDEPEIKIIDVFICKLRRKLAQAGAENIISTVWGQGYAIRDTSASAGNAAKPEFGAPVQSGHFAEVRT
jgi:two-component system cell cycle response regulator CtrA